MIQFTDVSISSNELTGWPLGDQALILEVQSQNSLWIKFICTSCVITQVNTTEPRYWEVNIGSGNGLVLSGTKPLLEPMLTQTYVPYDITRPQLVN